MIGNGSYVDGIPALHNPPNDATSVAYALRQLGFDVRLVIDGNKQRMAASIHWLVQTSLGADAAVLFYAGHAAEAFGQNFLFPVSIRPDPDSLTSEAVRFDDLLDQLAGRATTTLIFLDACRNNPFVGRNLPTVKESRAVAGATRSVGAGLAKVEAAPGTLIAFSTAPGTVALDGTGSHSPFTAAFLMHLETPEIDVHEMLSRVRRAVRVATDGQQVPWENSSLEDRFFFNPQLHPLLRRAVAYAQSRSIPLPDLRNATIRPSNDPTLSGFVGVWTGDYVTGRAVLAVVFSISDAEQHADMLIAEGPRTPRSRAHAGPAWFYRGLGERKDDCLLLISPSRWTYRLRYQSVDVLEYVSAGLHGEAPATTTVRREKGG